MSCARILLSLVLISALSCGPGVSPTDDGGTGDGDGGGECADCTEDQVCVPGLGCRDCIPDQNYCNGETDDEVWLCNEDGTGGTFVEDCAEQQSTCHNGFCLTPCERADAIPSNVGCHFWAVDLDNEAYDMFGTSNDAAAQQFAIALANNDILTGTAKVYKNIAAVGQPLNEVLVAEVPLPANDIVRIDLEQREVDGCMGQNGAYVMYSGSGTFVSSHAFRVETTVPVVAYQFQPIIQQFSNDASILIPESALGRHYYVLGYPTANPCGSPPGDPMHMASIPDHTSVTIVGVHPNTHIQVFPTHPVMASGGDSGAVIAETAAGGVIEVDIGPYDVVNLESLQFVGSIVDCISHLDQDGDFTGTKIISNLDVIVFSSHERGIGTGGVEIPTAPGWESGDSCCTDHLEQQMLPTTALGWKFAISRSPLRSTDPSWKEPDVYRVLATEDGTTVTTNLGGEYASFTLNAGEFKGFWAQGGFTLESSPGAVMVGQYLISQEYIPQGGIGDPTLTIFPPAEQHRDSYVFLVPPTFEDNYMVLAIQEGSVIYVDSQPLAEFNDCVTGDVGTIDSITYTQLTCPMSEGKHTVSSDKPVGLTVYGYYNVGSYGYPGGSDVRLINPIE